MSTILTDWRKAVITYLEQTFPGAEVIAGARTGVSRDKVRICVFWPGWPTDANVSLARPRLIIRYWPARSKQPTDNPNDPTQLEQAAVDLMAAMQPKQNTGAFVPNLYCWIDSIQPDYDPEEWGVEAVVVAWTVNLATQPAP